MAAGESAVNRASMAQAAQQVEAAAGVIAGLQATMNGYTSQLGGGWQGNAAVAFTSAYEAFSADFAKVLNALEVIHDKLVSTRNTYQATEDANTARVNSVASLIGGGAGLGSAAVKGAAAPAGATNGKGGADIASNQTPATTAGGNSGEGGVASGFGGAASGFGGVTNGLGVGGATGDAGGAAGGIGGLAGGIGGLLGGEAA